MPLALDPDMTFPLWLESDATKPVASRPVFLCRYLSIRKARQFTEVCARLNECTTTTEALAVCREAFALCLAGWRNMRLPDQDQIAFSLDAMDDALTENEMIELLGKCAKGVADAPEVHSSNFSSGSVLPVASNSEPSVTDAVAASV